LPDVANSSTKKAAKLAQKGKGQKVRFQGGTIFPLAVALTLIVGLGLIVYARQTLPAADDTPPTIDDHWHAAYGFYLCDGWVQLNGNLEERTTTGELANRNFRRTGIHSHDDGIIHWHPYSSAAIGKNAKLGVFLDTYDVELTDDKLVFPSETAVGPNENYLDQAPSEILQEYVEGETKCNGEDAELSVRAWGLFTDTDAGDKYIANMDNIHVDNDSMVFAIYFGPDDGVETMPPWAQQLPTLGEADAGATLQDEFGENNTGDDTSDTSDTSDSGTAEATNAGTAEDTTAGETSGDTSGG
jgi:hypothetical protein